MSKTGKENDTIKAIDKIDRLIKLADFYVSRFDGRREFEWKVTIGLWGAILGSIAVSSNVLEGIPIPSYLLIIFGLLIFFGHWLWLSYTWRAHRYDKDTAFKFSKAAALLLKEPVGKWKPKKVFCLAPSMAFQLYITALLLVAVVVLFGLEGNSP